MTELSSNGAGAAVFVVFEREHPAAATAPGAKIAVGESSVIFMTHPVYPD